MAHRWRRRIIPILILTFFVFTIIIYKDDVRELPDRWHGPFLNPEPKSSLKSPDEIFDGRPANKSKVHPIDDLIRRANLDSENLLSKQSSSLSSAATAYRARRGRHPPPNFDQWFDFASSHGCLVVEDFFDQIYRDIEPFWGLDPAEIRNLASSSPDLIRIRNGHVSRSNAKWQFVNLYFEMLKGIEKYLPDVDLPINTMDESRVILSWESVNDLIERSMKSRTLQSLPTTTSFGALSEDEHPVVEKDWIHEGPYWNLVREGCHPESPGRSVALDTDFSIPPTFPTTWPNHSYQGYVQNWTISKDPCIHAHLRNMHGSFVEPISQSTTTKLVPIFSGSKMPFNNDILLPGAVYWHDDGRFSSNNARIPWSRKRDEVIWRGSASGGRNTEHNWVRFHRHRLLSMLNGTQVEMALNSQETERSHRQDIGKEQHSHPYDRNLPGNFPLPNQSLYHLESFAQGLLPDWIRSLSNAAFTWLVCFPPMKDYACSYTGSWYRRGVEIPLHRMFLAKYLPDVDGNSFSGRFRAFLQSKSLPIKATIYNEWHDDRLIAWKHFVPIDNTLMDLWAVLEYLVGHDDAAQKIAEEGSQWANRVLRKEDMLVYVYRLILEYARVSSDEREMMGWIPK